MMASSHPRAASHPSTSRIRRTTVRRLIACTPSSSCTRLGSPRASTFCATARGLAAHPNCATLIISCSEVGKYVLSVVLGGVVEHVLIEPVANGTMINEYHLPSASVVDVCMYVCCDSAHLIPGHPYGARCRPKVSSGTPVQGRGCCPDQATRGAACKELSPGLARIPSRASPSVRSDTPHLATEHCIIVDNAGARGGK